LRKNPKWVLLFVNIEILFQEFSRSSSPIPRPEETDRDYDRFLIVRKFLLGY